MEITTDEMISVHNQCIDHLNLFQNDELMIAATLLRKSLPKSIPASRKPLIQFCLNTLLEMRAHTRIEELEGIKRDIDKYAHKDEDFNWIPDPIPKRLEALLRDQIGDDWIEVGELSNKKQFILMYNLLAIKGKEPSTLDNLKSDWRQLKNLNELAFANKNNPVEFLEFFRHLYEKHLQERRLHYTNRRTLLRALDDIEDALIWLDDFSGNSDERKLLVDKIKKTWKQKEYREKSDRVQKNFMLPKKTADTLKMLAETNDLKETEIISILILQEAKKSTHIKTIKNRAAAIEQALTE